MQEMHEPAPEAQGIGAIRSRRRPPRRRTPAEVPEDWSDEAVNGRQGMEALLASHQAAVAATIEQGVRALHRTAARLMGQLAGRADAVSPEDSARGLLTHVDERYQALTLRIERLEGALRKLVQTLKGSAFDSGDAASALSERIDTLAAAVEEAATRQRMELQAFTRQTGRGLAQVAARTGEGLARVAQRQEALLDDHLEDMRRAIDGLGRVTEPRVQASPEDQGEGSGGAERAASAFTERLRAAEERLVRVSDELSGWDPFVEEAPASGGARPQEPSAENGASQDEAADEPAASRASWFD